ncbi:hypothetical protein CBL_07880 [Carabus blaptoides fortunei]
MKDHASDVTQPFRYVNNYFSWDYFVKLIQSPLRRPDSFWSVPRLGWPRRNDCLVFVKYLAIHLNMRFSWRRNTLHVVCSQSFVPSHGQAQNHSINPAAADGQHIHDQSRQTEREKTNITSNQNPNLKAVWPVCVFPV